MITELIASYLRLLVAPNPGPMTLDGTNTWIVGDPSLAPPAVVDPGPLNDDHLSAILNACRGQVAMIILTHGHADHAEAAAELASRAECDVRAADPALQIGRHGLIDRDALLLGGVGFEVFATPGHTSDSCSLLLRGEDDNVSRLLTGDMVLGRGTTVITHPEGNLADYFTSLDLMSELVASYEVAELLPGHGPRVGDPTGCLDYYRTHRLARLEQVRQALAAGDDTAAGVVARVYADVDPELWPAAEESVRAQLDYLARE
jgi:glyoxylase-like metal-dependent hydrolase (beta-lactamase superfamily II)